MIKMKHYIIKFSKEWADGFDYEGVFLCTGEELKEVQDRAKELEDEYIEHSFGTHEGFEDYTVKELWESISILEITEEMYNHLDNILPNSGGLFSTIMEYEEE